MKSGDYSIRWKHNVFEKKTKNVDGKEVIVKKELKKKSTSCVIYDKNDEIVAVGLAKCNAKEDVFARPVGRKVSFSDAVSKISDKNLRTQFWDQFKKENKILVGKS